MPFRSHICFCFALLGVFLTVAQWLSPSVTVGEDWPQWRGADRNATIDDDRIPDALPAGQMPLLWSTPVGPGYSGPTVAGNRVYLTDRQGDDGQTYERILCLDADSGDVIWQLKYAVAYSIGYQASGPRASVTIDAGRAYAVGGMGMFHCLNAATGEIVWKHDLAQEYKIEMPIWGITAAPIIVDNLVIQIVAGAGPACVVAFDTATGTERWRALDEKSGYSAPILIRQGDQDVLVCWTGESVTGLDPKSGESFWSIPLPSRNMPIGVATPVVEGDKLFVSSFYDGAMLIEVDLNAPNAEKLWHRIGQDERNTDALHSMISTPVIKDGWIYGVDSYGEMRCLDMATGDRVWEDLTAVPKDRWATIHIIRNGDDEIMLNDQGELLLTTLMPEGLVIHSRSQLIPPTLQQLRRREGVVWSHPAIADGIIYARNDEKIVAAKLHR